jgi:predicted amidophosphoribosyltransferase
MTRISKIFNFFLNRCPSCGLSATTICARCWYVLNDIGGRNGVIPRGLYNPESGPFTQRVLYLWDDRVPRPASILRDMILSAKVNPTPESLQLWASELTVRARMCGALSGKRGWLVIPPPGRSGYGERDHAGGLAEALAAANVDYFLPETGALERVGESRRAKSQKLKSRDERLRVEFRIAESAKNRIRHAPGFLFIDDVIATGATARAAWAALGKPHAFESWAIAYKVRESDRRLETISDSDRGSMRSPCDAMRPL